MVEVGYWFYVLHDHELKYPLTEKKKEINK